MYSTGKIGKISVEEVNQMFEDGIFLFCSGKYEEAIKCFDKILATRPHSKMASGYKGLALLKLNRHWEAVKCYEKALTC